MGARDRRQADALDRSWDALVGRAIESTRPGDLDPSLAAVPRRLAALDRAAAPRGRAPSWSEVSRRLPQAPARGRSHRRPHWLTEAIPAPGNIVCPAERSRWRQPARWWPPLEFASALLLIAAMLGFAFGWDLPLRGPGQGPAQGGRRSRSAPRRRVWPRRKRSGDVGTRSRPRPIGQLGNFPDLDTPALWDQSSVLEEHSTRSYHPWSSMIW